MASDKDRECTDRDPGNYVGYDVVDRSDSRIGTLQCLWSDHTGEPAFIGVRTGWLFGKTHVVPAHQAQVNQREEKIRLPYDSQKVKDAPAYESDSEMDEAREWEICKYYGISTEQRQQQPAGSGAQQQQGRATPEQATIQLSEEELKVGKRQVEAGGVRLRKIIRTEIVNQPVELKREEIVIERVPAEQAHTGRQKAFQEQEVYIPLRREEAVIQKETHLREEVQARKRTQTEQQEVSEQVRREDVEIEETGEAQRTDRPRPRPGEPIREREDLPRSQRRRGQE